MGGFFAELKRRHIYRVAAAYAVVAWVLLQLVNNVAPILDLPVWVARAFLLALVIGFPVAVLLAWIVEAAPQNAVGNGAKNAAPAPSSTKVDWVIAGALIVVIALVSYQQLAPSQSVRTAQASATPAVSAPAGGISIAVLPFGNLSGDAGQEFFSDGMTEEITAALAKVKDLQVVARASAFQFKGEKKDMRAVGQALGARYLIDGSVRKAGTRVRITAELVRADNGVNLWSENYDRELTDIFAIQEDIAQAIAASLRVPLGLQQGETLSSRAFDLDSYQQYLRAKALYRSRGEGVTQAITILEALVARDPNYAPAWGLLARGYLLLPQQEIGVRGASLEESRNALQANIAKAEMAAQRAIQLDSKIASDYGAMGTIQAARGKLVEAEDIYKRALAADPGDPDMLHGYSQFLDGVGRLKESLNMREKLRTLEPFLPVFNTVTAAIMQQAGQYQASISILQALPPGNPGRGFLAQAYAAAGHYAEAADSLLLFNEFTGPRRAVQDAARLLRSAPAKAAEPLPDLEELSFVYAYIGAPDRIMDFPERSLEIGARVGINVANARWGPLSAPVRKTERFKAYARKAGLVDYWKARGWPDLCRPVGTDDFVCD